ncbi:MAG TPA: hypothetical protein VFG31_10610 [Conexibacter sp.]|nr:hypothetical protein [Conexibacter sp.]
MAEETDRPAPHATTIGGVGARLLDLAIQALPAIAGAVGFVGFVAVLGAAIDWTRFAAAGLPADQAVRAIDRPELVATGAVSLIAFTLLALLAVLAAYLLDPRAEANPGVRRGAIAVAIIELLVVLWFTPASWWVYVLVVAGGVAFGFAAGRLFTAFGRWLQTRSRARDLGEQIERARRALFEAELARDAALRAEQRELWVDAERRRFDAVTHLALLIDTLYEESVVGDGLPDERGPRRTRLVGSDTAELDALAERLVRQLRELGAPRNPLRRGDVQVAVAAAVALVVATVVVVLAVDDARWIGIMIVVVALLNAAVYGVAQASKRFLWYGIAIFLSVPLFGAALGAARTYRFPKLQPVALIRKSSDRAICGIYVAENDKRVYIARVELRDPDDHRAEPGTGRLFWIPLSDVDMIKIGPAQSIRDANGRAPLLARELYADRAEQAPATLTPTQVQEVRDVGGARRTTTSEHAVQPGVPVAKPRPTSPTASCTSETLATPLPAARKGWNDGGGTSDGGAQSAIGRDAVGGDDLGGSTGAAGGGDFGGGSSGGAGGGD